MSEFHQPLGPRTGRLPTPAPIPDVADVLSRPGVLRAAHDVLFRECRDGRAYVLPDGRLVACNPAFCRTVGYTEPELIGRTFEFFTVPEDFGPDMALFTQVVDGTLDRYEMDKRYRTRLGETVPVHLEVYRVCGEDGLLAFAVGAVSHLEIDQKYLRTEVGPDGRPVQRPLMWMSDFLRDNGVSPRWLLRGLAAVVVSALTAAGGAVSVYYRAVATAEVQSHKLIELADDLKQSRAIEAAAKDKLDRLEAETRVYRDRMESQVAVLIRELAGVKRSVQDIPK